MRKARMAAAFGALALAAVGGALGAAPPEQFQVWGSAGPELPPVPQGWTEVRGTPDGPAALAPTPDEARRGYAVFARDPLVEVSPYSLPFPSERATELKAFAAQGEYEPLSFCIHALDALSEVSVEVSELRSAKDGAIPSDHVDVRVVRCIRVPVDAKAKTYRLQPFVIEKRKTFSVPQGRTAQVWLTLKVPEKAEGGAYSGTLTIRAAGREATPLKLSVQVLPFALPPAPIEEAMYYGHTPASDEMLLKELTDQREHGLNSFESAVGVQIKSRDRKFGEDDVEATRAHCQRMMDATKKVFGGWRFPVTFEVGHQIAYYWDQGKNWFVHWPHSPEIESDFYKAIDVVRDLAKAEGWPPLRAYAMDEAGAHNLLDEAVYLYGLIRKRYPDITTWTDIGGGIAMGHDEIGQLSKVVDIFSTNRFTPEIAQTLLARKKPYGVYNGAGHLPAGARYFFGFYGFKTGASQIAQWVYHFGDAAFKGNGFRQEDEGYVYSAPDGPLPSLYWEAVREGVDDYRYVHLLRLLIAAATASDRSDRSDASDTKKAATEAERALAQVLGQIGWGFQALATSERTLPPHPSTLRKWRRALASEIARLQGLVGRSPAALVVPTASPFDLPWAEPAKEEAKFGPELLPPSGFEKDMKPWRVEAWNGKGKGELDPAEHHGGKQSVRIEVPAGSGNQAVTILVWPSWGGSKVNVALEGGRTYEFSAWVKSKDRSVPPSMRLSLPAGAAKSTRDGQDKPTPDGWQRVWTRAELNFPIAPTYLGVWVQGPGTVWVDDLSLREAIPPPVSLSLDQGEYDGMDGVAKATVTVAGLVRPAQVRFTLSREGGEAVGQLAAPFESQASVAPTAGRGEVMLLAPVRLGRCQFVFNPSALAPGRYEAKVELLDGQGAAFAAKSATLTRCPDH